MINHLVVLAILVPMMTATTLLLWPTKSFAVRRLISFLGVAALLLVLFRLSEHISEFGTLIYQLGGWSAPFGITLLADRATLLFLWVTGFLALAAVLFAMRGEDGKGRRFHALFHFQLMGINGAFVAADLFNLFVFFEVLLIASYSLLMHGVGKQRTRAALHYVILNLMGSSLFLIALGMIYAGLGSLNMAHVSLLVSDVSGNNEVLVRGAGYLLLMVFGLKGGLLPLMFWLPRTYAAALGAVGALFAIMTKVGIYAMWRVFNLLFGSEAGGLEAMISPWLYPLAIMTMVMASMGIFASRSLSQMATWLVVLSAGTLMVVVSWHDQLVSGAGLFYLIQSTWVVAALFLVTALIRQQSGKEGDQYRAQVVQPSKGVSVLFFIAALACIGLPPLSGFFAKLQLLSGSFELAGGPLFWLILLLSSLMMLIGFSRAASSIFWRREPGKSMSLDRRAILSVSVLLAGSVLLVVFMEGAMTFTAMAAQDFHDVQAYRSALLPVEMLGGDSGADVMEQVQ